MPPKMPEHVKIEWSGDPSEEEIANAMRRAHYRPRAKVMLTIPDVRRLLRIDDDVEIMALYIEVDPDRVGIVMEGDDERFEWTSPDCESPIEPLSVFQEYKAGDGPMVAPEDHLHFYTGSKVDWK